MKVSINTIKQYVDIDLSIDELVKKINAQLGGVEEVIDLNEKYKDAIIVKVVQVEKHPDADRLSVCLVDDGGVVEDIERNTDGLVQVVCGAPNVHAGLFAVWLPPRATVPSTYDTDEPFVLDARNLRGVMSNGMLAAADELVIGTDHNGIVELNPDEWNPNNVAIVPGARFAEAYGLDDTVIDIENKMFTHRPDCFGQIGVAREIAGITGKDFREPTWHNVLPKFNRGEGLELRVENHAETVVPRWMAVAVKGVTIEPSPLWLQCELVRLGSKSISNIVDITNYVMLLTGQPTHAYDYDKVGSVLAARMARDDETITLLNGKTYELTSSDIVITDGEKPIGLGGVMGGADSEVTATTTNIILECANFDMYTVRKTSMRHGLFTDAVTRYNKGQSSLQQPYIIDLALKSILDTAGGVQASDVFDVSGELQQPVPIAVTVEFINERLGSSLTTAEVIALLEHVSIDVQVPGEANSYLEVTPPYWRTDLELPEDIVEEVGRLYGFDALPRELPLRSTAPTPRNRSRVVKQAIRNSLSRSGASEVLTYSFVHENIMARAQQPVDEAFRLSNALSPELQYYRLSVLPSLLDKVHMNIKAGYDEFVLFEIGKGHNKAHHADDDNGLPRELEFADGIYASRHAQKGAAYYRVRRIVEQLGSELGLSLVFTPADTTMVYAVTAPFALDRTAMVSTTQGEFIGIVGELKQEVQKAFKLPAYSAAFSLDVAGIATATGADIGSSYRPLSKYPRISQDISLRIANDVSYASLLASVTEATGSHDVTLTISMTPAAIYQAGDDTAHKTVTLHVEFTSFESTLKDSDVAPIMDRIADKASERVGAVRI
jgi:phenylalanyl-tRNA synthetase beta chain